LLSSLLQELFISEILNQVGLITVLIATGMFQ
jgi:hypothetical protein